MMRKVPLTLIAVCGVVAAALPSASPASAATPAHGSHVRGMASSPAGQAGIAWHRCQGKGSRFQCARVAVPLNWHRPGGTQIKLAVIRYLGSDQKHRIGSMFVDFGGPGVGGVDSLKGLGPMLSAWGRGRFNVVSWDPRGTSASDPVRCFTSTASRDRFWRGVQIPVTPAQSRAYARRAAALARRCGRVSGPLLDNISTEDTARDLNRLRQLAGDRTLTYVGLSYGTMIGQTYENLFPHRVRAMLLDGLINPVEYTASAERRVANQAGSADGVFFHAFVRQCQKAGPSGCALAGHSESVARRVARLFARARRAPIPAPHAKPPGVLDYSDLLLSTFNPLRIPFFWPRFARDLNAAANNNASALETAARLMRSPAGFSGPSGATVSSAISCLDGPASKPVSAWPSVIRHTTHAGRLWGPYLGWALWAPCAANWPGHPTERYAGPWNAKTKTPILLLSNRHDPATGYANAQAAQRLLGNAVLLTENGFGHLTLNDPSRCVLKWRIRYLVHLITPPRGTVCPANQPPFP
jgi:pimeloyl-ACP methyl ester carboxylesterase